MECEIKRKIELHETIGSGTSGIVIRGCDLDSNEEFAIKKIKPRNKNNVHSKNMMCDYKTDIPPTIFEACIMASINHPHILNAKNIIIDDDTLYIITDIAQCHLRDHICNMTLNKLTFSYEHIISLMFEITSAVHTLHSENIIHGDIKPQNILVFKNNNDIKLKLTDFTVSVFGRYCDRKIMYKYKETGTPRYRAPEVWLGANWSMPADIWSLGCVFYEMVYGKTIFHPENIKEQVFGLVQHLNADDKKLPYIIPPFDKRKKVNQLSIVFSPEFKQINDLILSMLDGDPNNRPTIDEIAHNQIFSSLKLPHYDIITHENDDCDSKTIAKISQSILKITNDNQVVTHSKKILYKMINSTVAKDHELLFITIASISIAQRLFYRKSLLNLEIIQQQLEISEPIDYNYIFFLEKEILQYLSFCIL